MGISPLLGARPPLRRPRDETWHDWAPRVGLEVDFAPQSVLAASVTWGFKTGGFALGFGGNISGQVFEPEELWTFEVLSKNEWFDDRLKLSLGFFWTDYSSYQNCFTRGAVFECRTGEATSYGAELELLAKPLPQLQLDLSLDALRTHIDQLIAPDPTLRLGDPFFGSERELAGRSLPRAPKFSASVGLQHGLDLGRFGRLTPRGQLRYRSRTYFEAYNHQDFSQDPFVEFGLRLTWTSADDAFLIEAFGENLSDVDVISNIFIGPLFSDSPVFAAYLPPRHFGLRFGWKF